MYYLKHVKPSAITVTGYKSSKSIAVISTCYILKYPTKAGCFWATKNVKRIRYDNYFSFRTLVQSLCEKYGVPFIPEIHRNDSVTVAHRNILLIHSTFVEKDLEKIYESIKS